MNEPMGRWSVGGMEYERRLNATPLQHSNTPPGAFTALRQRLLFWLRPQMPARRYRVTPRHNAYAFRRALVRDAMRELKRDAAFASLRAMNPNHLLNRR